MIITIRVEDCLKMPSEELFADYDYEQEAQYAQSFAEIPHSVSEVFEKGTPIRTYGDDTYASILELPYGSESMVVYRDSADSVNTHVTYVTIDDRVHVVVFDLGNVESVTLTVVEEGIWLY